MGVRVCSKVSVCVGSCPESDVDGLLQGRRAYGRRGIYGGREGGLLLREKEEKEMVGIYLCGFSLVCRGFFGLVKFLVE